MRIPHEYKKIINQFGHKGQEKSKIEWI